MKYLFLAISLLALVSCKDSKKQETTTNKDVVEQPVEAVNEHHNEEASNIYENDWTSKIEINNGFKWQANAETNEGVLKLKNIIKTQKTSTIDDYHKLAKQLNDDKNYLVKNCTMKGTSHDNLHVWLLPLIAKIDALAETKTVADAAKMKHSIKENINKYSNYFE